MEKNSCTTAMYFSGISWSEYRAAKLPVCDCYVAAVASADLQGVAKTDKDAVYGKNYPINYTFEDERLGIMDAHPFADVSSYSIVEGGYLSGHALRCARVGNSVTSVVCLDPVRFGEGYTKIPLDTWCDIRFQVRSTVDVRVGVGVMATVVTSKGNTYSFELSVPDRAPLDGENWIDMSMGFSLSMVDDSQASFTLKRYDWCYLLPDHRIQWEADEIPHSVVLMIYADTSEFLLDNIELSFEKQNTVLQPLLVAKPSLVAVGEEFTVDYTVCNTGDDVVRGFEYAFRYNPLALKALTSTEGAVDLLPRGSTTVSAVFRVLEGGAAIIKAVGSNGVRDTLVRVSCTGRGYYCGDSHSHSTESDGKSTPYENLKRYYDLGMSFNISADHNVEPTETANWDAALSRLREEIPNPQRFLQMKVTENSAIPNHAVQYFSPNRYDTPNTHEGWEEVIKKQKADGGLTYIAHPFLKTDIQFWPILEGPSVVLPQYKEADGFEIINSQTLDYTSETIPKALEWWDRYNITAWRRYYGIGNSDGHRLYELCGSYNCLLLEELTEENIKEAFTKGTLFFTTGPQLRYTLGGADMGGEVAVSSTGEKMELEVSAYTPNGNPIEKVVAYRYAIGSDVEALYQNGRDNAIVLYKRKYGEDISQFHYSGLIDVSVGDFVRVEVYAAHDPRMVVGNYQMAMSNPIWIVDRNA